MADTEDSKVYQEISQYDRRLEQERTSKLMKSWDLSQPQVARKDDSGKLRWDLVPVRPMEKVVEVFTKGAVKYSDRNWEKGLAWGRVFAAMMRHGWRWWNGEKYDKEDGQHHLSSVAWCALVLMEYEETCPEKDDRPASAKEEGFKPISLVQAVSDYYRWQQTAPFNDVENQKCAGVVEGFKKIIEQ